MFVHCVRRDIILQNLHAMSVHITVSAALSASARNVLPADTDHFASSSVLLAAEGPLVVKILVFALKDVRRDT